MSHAWLTSVAVICFEDVLAIRAVGAKHAKGLGGTAEQPILALMWYAWEKGNKKVPPRRVERIVLVQPKKSEKDIESGSCFSKLLLKNYKSFWTQFPEDGGTLPRSLPATSAVLAPLPILIFNILCLS